ncbi:MAG: phage tail assembly chaperone [Hominilimicola sp.]
MKYKRRQKRQQSKFLIRPDRNTLRFRGERSTTEYHNNLIYTATVDEDKQRIWGNNDIKQKFNIFDEADCVDILLNAGTKSKIVEEVLKLSGFDGEDVVDEEDYIKN